MTGRIVRSRNENIVVRSRRRRRVNRSNRNEPMSRSSVENRYDVLKDGLFEDGSEKFQSGFELSFWVVRFDDGRDDSNIDVFGADVVRVRNFRDVDIYENTN